MPSLLVVDDEWLIRKGIVQMVKRLDPAWSTEEAGNGREAIERIRAFRYDLIFCDIRMPVMDGLELLESLNVQGCRIPVVFLTGYDEFHLMRSAIRLRACDYILKPVHDDDILPLLHQFNPERMDAREEAAGNKIIRMAKDYIEQHLDDGPSLIDVANHVHFNPTYFSEYFKEKCGETFSQYVMRVKIEKAKQMLEDPANRILDISGQLGYKDPRSFTKMFKLMTGMTPKEYRNQGL